MKWFCSLVAIFLFSTSVMAEEVLYCTDTAANGFRFNKDGNAKATQFKPSRFTVKVLSENKRLIQSDDWPEPIPYTCFKRVDVLSCVHPDGVAFDPINFGINGYTRARLLSRPIFDLAVPDMYVAYGTCSKF